MTLYKDRNYQKKKLKYDNIKYQNRKKKNIQYKIQFFQTNIPTNINRMITIFFLYYLSMTYPNGKPIKEEKRLFERTYYLINFLFHFLAIYIYVVSKQGSSTNECILFLQFIGLKYSNMNELLTEILAFSFLHARKLPYQEN